MGKMNNENHLPDLGNHLLSDEMTARPADVSAVHTSLAGVEEDDNFAGEVNG